MQRNEEKDRIEVSDKHLFSCKILFTELVITDCYV